MPGMRSTRPGSDSVGRASFSPTFSADYCCAGTAGSRCGVVPLGFAGSGLTGARSLWPLVVGAGFVAVRLSGLANNQNKSATASTAPRMPNAHMAGEEARSRSTYRGAVDNSGSRLRGGGGVVPGALCISDMVLSPSYILVPTPSNGKGFPCPTVGDAGVHAESEKARPYERACISSHAEHSRKRSRCPNRQFHPNNVVQRSYVREEPTHDLMSSRQYGSNRRASQHQAEHFQSTEQSIKDQVNAATK
jgi:hypothetical protein